MHRRLVALYRCPGCGAALDPSSPPRQCRDGHLVCGDCATGPACPTCEQPPAAAPNLAMQRIAALLFPASASAPQQEAESEA